MMSKANWTLLIILGIQALIILVLDNPCSSGYYRETSEDATASALFPGLEKESVASFKIEKGEQSIVLDRGNLPEEGWVLRTAANKYAADQFSVDTLLTSLTRLKKLDVVSRNPDKASKYELDGASAIYLTVSGQSGEELARLMVGKNLGALRGTYVKLPGMNEVYLQLENIRRACDKGEDWLDAWRDKTVFTCDREAITRVEVDGPEGRVVMEYHPPEEVEEPEPAVPGGPPRRGPIGTWHMLEPREGKVKEWEGRRLVEVIANMKAQGFAKPGQTVESLGLAEPEATIMATLTKESGETQLKITLGKEQEGSRYIILDDDASTIYKMANYQFYAFIRKPEELLDEPPAPVEEKKENAEGEGAETGEEGAEKGVESEKGGGGGG